jgi:hypothetical protein
MLRLWQHENGKLYIRGTAEKGAKPLFESTGFVGEQIEEAQDYLEKRRADLRTERLFGKKATIGFAEAMTDYVENGGSANSDRSRPPIPISFRPPFRFEAGHRSEMKPAT